jgi:hypothetical protein
MMDILFKLGIKRQKHNELNQTLNWCLSESMIGEIQTD